MKKKDPSKLEVLSEYEINGSLKSLVERFQAILAKHPNAHIERWADDSCCFYESDHPTTKFTIRSKRP